MPEYVRVKQAGTGHEATIERSQYDRAPDGWKLLDKAATDAAGRPLPPKYHVLTSGSRRQANNAQPSGQKATTGKEGA